MKIKLINRENNNFHIMRERFILHFHKKLYRFVISINSISKLYSKINSYLMNNKKRTKNVITQNLFELALFKQFQFFLKK